MSLHAPDTPITVGLAKDPRSKVNYLASTQPLALLCLCIAKRNHATPHHTTPHSAVVLQSHSAKSSSNLYKFADREIGKDEEFEPIQYPINPWVIKDKLGEMY